MGSNADMGPVEKNRKFKRCDMIPPLISKITLDGVQATMGNRTSKMHLEGGWPGCFKKIWPNQNP